jgi:hypothetical protein
VLLQNGSPRAPLTVARYRLRAPSRPGRVGKPSAKRTSRGVTIRWRRARRASEYLVTIKQGSTVVTRTTTTRTTVTYAGAPATTLAIRITPRDRFGRQGRAATVKVR